MKGNNVKTGVSKRKVHRFLSMDAKRKKKTWSLK